MCAFWLRVALIVAACLLRSFSLAYWLLSLNDVYKCKIKISADHKNLISSSDLTVFKLSQTSDGLFAIVFEL